MASVSSIVSECRLESTKVEFALHRLLFSTARRDRAAMVQNIVEARRALHAQERRLREMERSLRRRLALAGKAVA